jgi:hypothetical protein
VTASVSDSNVRLGERWYLVEMGRSRAVSLFAVTGLTAAIACGKTDVQFACGNVTCDSASQYCESIHQGGVLDGGLTTGVCLPLPAACTSNVTCDCLKDMTPIACPSGSVVGCTSSGDAVTVHESCA